MNSGSAKSRLFSHANPSPLDDQATSLRRLVASRPNQVIAFAGGARRCGRTTLVVESALALARAGQRVIVVDENEGNANAIVNLGLMPEGDLIDALMLQVPLSDLVMPVEPNLWVAYAAKAAALLRFDSPKAQEIATTLISPMEAAANFVLIDSLVLEGGHLSLLSAQAHHMVIVVAASPDAIRGAYAVIKRLVAERGREGFYLAITGAQTDAEAATIYGNVKRTAERYLGVRVDFLANLNLPLPRELDQILLRGLPISSSRGRWPSTGSG